MSTRNAAYRISGAQEKHGHGYDDEDDTDGSHADRHDSGAGKYAERASSDYAVEDETDDERNSSFEGEGDEATNPDDDDDGHHVESPNAKYYEQVSSKSRVKSATVDTGTPGKVVETGKEHTGRWTKAEHEAFLAGLKMYGKEWKKVAARVKTRTVVQTRTHAQKYFQKLHKTAEDSGNDYVSRADVGGTGETRRGNSQKARRLTETVASTPLIVRPLSPMSRKQNRRSSSSTFDAAQVISNLSGGSKLNPLQSVTLVPSLATTPSITPPLKHGFSTEPGLPSWVLGAARGPNGTDNNMIKISAPDPSLSLRKGFPEPSPAATGKRKLAEIAAARMLAGVGSSPLTSGGVDECPPTPPPSSLGLADAPFVPALSFSGYNSLETRNKASLVPLQIVNPEALGVTFGEQLKRKRDGDGSPVTPWEGQLKALVDEKVTKKVEADFGLGFESTSPLANSLEPASFRNLLPVCGPSRGYNRSKVHEAVCDIDDKSLDDLLMNKMYQSGNVLNRQDDAGFRPLHSACAMILKDPDSASTIIKIISRLLDLGADPSLLDSDGNTSLHWAARSGERSVVRQLLDRSAAVDARNKSGETPLHHALRSGLRGIDAAAELLDSGARPSITDSQFRRPVDVAGEGFLDEPQSVASIRAKEQTAKKSSSKELKKLLKDTADARRESRANLLIRSPQSRSLVLHHPECLEHHPKSSTDWEAPDRITAIIRRVIPSFDSTGAAESSGIFPHEVVVSQEFDRATLSMLSRVHSTEYLSFVNNLSNDLKNQAREPLKNGEKNIEEDDCKPPVVPFTPLVQRTMIKVDESSVKLSANSDTSFSSGSLKAARRAAGSVQHAVDCVLVGRNRNAFCVVRPPGHHAGINGLLEGGESCGFCIFNNVAAGALYAISDDRLLCERCAIVDIDVHHGNGTEEIVRRCNDPSKLFFFSIHLYDNDKRKGKGQFQYKFYPGTGSDDDLALNIINVPIVPLWKDQSSQASPVKTHNTRKKAKSTQDVVDDSSTGTGRGSDGASEGGSGSTSIGSPRHASGKSGRTAYREAILTRLLPSLRAFNPDLIIISAGFDACKGDVGNARHERGGEKMGLDLEPEDYAWTTRKILEVADMCCHGRVVSVLEGGYGRTPVAKLEPGAEDKLDRTVFAECAVRHLHALIDPYDCEQRFTS
ncbi:hypothetical protein FisN_5Hh340 [Fistulifera solaris]|uniref:histone deacetylase n=1 Tax=Fistulifera solaris TaxID=1519565 RepID=A0A1Z5JSY0_FISSO|nr:hypothetical protein FisN_5Hh340 [Fistulifera solaris]|eukprot:GAX16962.1 hypothetical protein FisN_5Hh340 [Fistulifera solaris]